MLIFDMAPSLFSSLPSRDCDWYFAAPAIFPLFSRFLCMLRTFTNPLSEMFLPQAFPFSPSAQENFALSQILTKEIIFVRNPRRFLNRFSSLFPSSGSFLVFPSGFREVHALGPAPIFPLTPFLQELTAISQSWPPFSTQFLFLLRHGVTVSDPQPQLLFFPPYPIANILFFGLKSCLFQGPESP